MHSQRATLHSHGKAAWQVRTLLPCILRRHALLLLLHVLLGALVEALGPSCGACLGQRQRLANLQTINMSDTLSNSLALH